MLFRRQGMRSAGRHLRLRKRKQRSGCFVTPFINKAFAGECSTMGRATQGCTVTSGTLLVV